MALLAGRKMIVVGGSYGIGRGIADAWAAEGADVTVCSRTQPVDAHRLGWERMDLTEPDDARERLSVLGSGQVDAVCFAAVYYGEKRANFGDVSESEWRRQVETNTTGLWLTLHATQQSLRQAESGVFVGVSSEVAFNGGSGRSGYAASKAAAKSLLDSVAQEDDAVAVVQVMPSGMVDTPGIRRRRPPDFDYGSYARPSCFGRVAIELAATAGAGHHGDSLVVDGNGDWWSAYDDLPTSQTRVLT